MAVGQNRIWYASQSIHFAECGTTSYTLAHGVQSLGVTTRFDLGTVFEMGQAELYEQFEEIPNIEVTVEKVLDGYPLLYHLATKNSTSATLAGRSNKRATVGLAIFSDAQDSASGTPIARSVMSGMYVQSLSYNFGVQNSFTESVTLVGNNAVWNDSFSFTSMANTDEPLAIAGSSGGVQQRQDLLFGPCDTSVSQPSACVLPADIYGLTSSGTNEQQANGSYSVHVQSIKVSSNLGREQLLELGRRGPYYRYVQFPVQVSTEIEVIANDGARITADESSSSNLSDRRIWLRTREGTKIDLGTKNKLNNVTYGGANAAQNGGNANLTFSYQNFSRLTVYHPADPSGL